MLKTTTKNGEGLGNTQLLHKEFLRTQEAAENQASLGVGEAKDLILVVLTGVLVVEKP